MVQFLCDHQSLIVTGLTLGLVVMFPFRHMGGLRLPRRNMQRRGQTVVIEDPVEAFKNKKLAQAPLPLPQMGKTPASLSGVKLVAINPGNRWKEAIVLPESEQ